MVNNMNNEITTKNNTIFVNKEDKQIKLFNVEHYPGNCSAIIFYNFNFFGEKERNEYLELIKNNINNIAINYSVNQILIADIKNGFGYFIATSLSNSTLLSSVFNNNSGNFVYLFSIIAEKET